MNTNSINMTTERLHQLALALLDDDHGINEKAWQILCTILIDNDCGSILNQVRGTEGRYYIDENAASLLRQTDG